MSIPDNQKRRGRPATGVTPLQGVRMPSEMVSAIDQWAAGQPDKPSRAEAIRRLVEQSLKLGEAFDALDREPRLDMDTLVSVLRERGLLK